MARKPRTGVHSTAFEPTKAQRDAIAIDAAAGMSHADIAMSYGVSVPVLRASCMDELTTLASKKRSNVNQRIYQAAMDGNITAARAFLARPANNGGPLANAVQVGKKQQRNVEATTAADSTEWQNVAGQAN